jgi:hypothetical protein
MEGLITLLLFAAFFYFMMRFGCGSHMVHGNQSQCQYPIKLYPDSTRNDV